MEFLFQLSAYDDPVLDSEEIQLMDQLLEANSRNAVPGLWKITDKLNSHAAKGANRPKHVRFRRIYGAVMLALGIFLLVPGLMEPKELLVPLVAGAVGVLLGLSLLLFPKRPVESAPTRQARLAGSEQLARMRKVDWSGIQVRFDADGLAVLKGEEARKTVPYTDLTGVFASEHAFLVGWGDGALLLQKRDLTAGDAADFLPYLQEKIDRHAIKTDKESTT